MAMALWADSMVIKRVLWMFIVTTVISATEITFGATPTGKTFPALTVGATTYTNVTITDVSGGSVFLRHSRGFESLRIESLDARTLSELGIEAMPPRSAQRNGKAVSGASPSGPTVQTSRIENQGDARQWNRIGSHSMPEGIGGTILGALMLTGFCLIFAGWIMFIVAAFGVGPWWGLGVLFGGVTCGIVPLIFFFTHLEESKKAFFCSVGGFALIVTSGGIAITLEQTQAAKARQKAMISHHQAWV